MPPRTTTAHLTSQFTVTPSGENNEVVCPLRNQDGSACRKRCLGEKKYRSMQEHIRRAHPEFYIAKLPATKESFDLMITSPPHEKPAIDPNHANHHHHHHSQSQSHSQQQQQQHHLQQQHSDPSGLSPNFHFDNGLGSSLQGYDALGQHDGGYYSVGDPEAIAIYNNMQVQNQRSSDEFRRGSLIPAVSAAAALAQLHYHRPESDSGWPGGDGNIQNYYNDGNDYKNNQLHVDPALQDPNFMHDHSYSVDASQDPQSLIPGGLARSPSDRPTTVPTLGRSLSRSGQANRPRKSSLTQSARMGKHERKRSKELGKKGHSGGNKALSAEPSHVAHLYGKRWEDLIDAAASATEEEGSRDLTPIPASPYQSPQVNSRTSLPPFALGSQFQSFQASPLNRALTPPPAPEHTGLDLQTFPSVDSSLSSNLSHHHHNSADSGSQFHIMNPSSIDSTSSPMFNPNKTNNASSTCMIYCSACHRKTGLNDSFGCTGCMAGVCGSCTEALVNEQSRGRAVKCPRCSAMDTAFKAFSFDLA